MTKRKIADADRDMQLSEEFVEEFNTKPTWDDDGVQASAGIGLDGKEYGDPTPLAPPVGFDAPPDLMEMMRQMIRSEQYQAQLEQEGFDTLEEAGDFDVDDDPLPPLTIHEAILQQPASPPAPVVASPPAAASPQVETAKQGGEEAGSPKGPPPEPPQPPTAPPVRPT